MSNEIISRREFIKVVGIAAGGLFDLKFGVTALGRTFKKFIRQGSQAEGAEGVSNHKFSVFVSDLDTQGGLVILDETAGALFAITGQPKIGPDPKANGSYAYFFEGGVQSITGVVRGKNTLDENYLFNEESRQPRRSKNRTRANVGETIIRIAPENVVITPEAITKGKVGSSQYQERLMANEKLINGLPEAFAKYGYTLVESPIGGSILGSAILTETTNSKKGTSNLLVQFYVRAWRLDNEGNKIYNFLPVGKGGIRLNKVTHPLVPDGPAFESVAGGGIKVAAVGFVPEIFVPTPHVPELSLPADFPPDFKAEIGDKKWQKVNGIYQVMAADGNWQDWYETKPDGNVQTTDWKMHQETPLKIGFEPEKNWRTDNGGTVMSGFPVITGEPPVERNMVLNGQEITVTLLPVQIRDILDLNKIVDVFLPLRYTDAVGQVLLETWVTTENGEITMADFLQSIERGQQLDVNIELTVSRGVCNGFDRCEVVFDLQKSQGLAIKNKIIRDGDILPIGLIMNWLSFNYIRYRNLNH